MSVTLAFDPLPLLVGTQTLAASGSYKIKADVTGFKFIRGAIFSSVAPAALYPRVRQSMDGSNWDIIDVIVQDLSQANYLYTFDVEIFGTYAFVELVDAGAGSTVRASVFATVS